VTTLKAMENRLRRRAHRQGLHLSESAGLYALIDMKTKLRISSHYSLADVEAYLTKKKKISGSKAQNIGAL